MKLLNYLKKNQKPYIIFLNFVTLISIFVLIILFYNFQTSKSSDIDELNNFETNCSKTEYEAKHYLSNKYDDYTFEISSEDIYVFPEISNILCLKKN